MRRIAFFAATAALLWTTAGSADEKVFKHDQFSDNIYEAADEVNGKLLQTEPGFVDGEAFGVLFRPSLNDYPLKLLAVDVLFSGPEDVDTNIDIEIYLDAGQGPAPKNPEPDFKISNQDYFDPINSKFGIPIFGSHGYSFEFNYDDPEGAPPEIYEGNVLVMIRYTKPAQDLEAEYGTPLCSKLNLPPLGEICGCQPAGMILDNSLTKQTNVMSLVWPLGQCSGAKQWKWFEDLEKDGKSLKGDAIIRLKVQSSDSVCVGDCEGKECGDDGCGESCGTCTDGLLCKVDQCVEPPTCNCEGKVCGDDGCGNSCGTCPDGNVCESGACKPPDTGCTPKCDGKTCGDDTCGGTCAPGCGAGYTCDAGGCIEDTGGTDGPDIQPGELSVTSISPAKSTEGTSTNVSITGTGFLAKAKVKLGGTDLSPVEVISETLISTVVPAHLTAGKYSVIVINDDGGSSVLTDGYEVEAAGPVCGDAVCQDNEDCKSCPADCGGCSSAPAGGCETVASPTVSSAEGLGPLAPLFLVALLVFMLPALRRRP